MAQDQVVKDSANGYKTIARLFHIFRVPLVSTWLTQLDGFLSTSHEVDLEPHRQARSSLRRVPYINSHSRTYMQWQTQRSDNLTVK